MKKRTESIICWIIYFVAFLAILIPTNYDFDQWQLWSLFLGGFGLYGLGRYEGIKGL